MPSSAKGCMQKTSRLTLLRPSLSHIHVLLHCPGDKAKDPLSPSSSEPLAPILPGQLMVLPGLRPTSCWEVWWGSWWEGARLSIRELPSCPELPTWQDISEFASHAPLLRNHNINSINKTWRFAQPALHYRKMARVVRIIIYQTQQKIVKEKVYNEVFVVRKLHVLLV
jgi:hypothetical protein